MQFLVDAQLPPALARWLVSQGHHAWHVADLGLANAEDGEIWRQAIASQAVLITKDQDFIVLRHQAHIGPVIVWFRIGNTTNQALVGWFALGFPEVVKGLADGETIIEVR